MSIDEWRRQFPAIPGIATPRAPNALPLLDFGPDVERGILKEPPDIVPGKQYTVLVPAVDRDGNDVPGVRAPMVAAPLGTYTGWNPRARGHGHGAQLRFEGSYIPFPDSPQEREATGDPRALHPGALCRQGGLCRGDHRGGARTRGAGADAGGGCGALRRRRGELGTAAA